MNIPRLALIQSLIDKNGYQSYLEIGVSIGTVFFRVRCKKKFAVDPEFRFNRTKIFTRSLRLGNFSNFSARYFEKTSDAFFTENAKSILPVNLGLSLVDGMHEYQFALNDIENVLQFLAPNGVIIVHDCNPRSAEGAVSFSEWKDRGFTGEWNGDVWKSIVHLRAFRNDVNVFVADTDQGLGIITRKTEASPGTPALPFHTKEEIHALSYADLEKNREAWLNLKPAGYLNELFGLNLPF